ncbi:hypothetical protein [Salegentibacter sp. Hel_I_6]|uniref:hypothetical protein n=1 Tax=Salegentibacter sp. Hel_I_6 TaxID=1250278 RepID=UPI00055D418D|nr:hypothetical protein [Salegentibacter sp. Hel_I_6]
MINKILKYGTTIGIAICIIGFIISESFSLSDEFNGIIETIYKLTLTISVLFLLTVSKFINEKFDLILKVVGIVFLISLVINLLIEFNVYHFQINIVEIIPLILISGLYLMYFKYFLKKNEKNKIDYLKITFLTVFLINGFLSLYDLYSSVFKTLNQVLFWTVIIGFLVEEHTKSKTKYVG